MKAVNPDRAEFAQLLAACGDGPVPFAVRLPNDLCTPVGSYAHIARKARYSFFLESVELGKRLGRYSFMGANPQRIFICRDQVFCELDGAGEEISSCRTDDPLRELEKHWRAWQARWPESLALPPLAGGMIGYMGYDCVPQLRAARKDGRGCNRDAGNGVHDPGDDRLLRSPARAGAAQPLPAARPRPGKGSGRTLRSARCRA